MTSSINDEGTTTLRFTYRYTSYRWYGPLRMWWRNRIEMKALVNQLNEWKAEEPLLEIVWPESITLHLRDRV